jgi:D-alanyl-D-alanine dipeptidase
MHMSVFVLGLLWMVHMGGVFAANVLEKIEERIPSIFIDLRYATAANFLGEQIYPRDMPCLVHKDLIAALAEVQGKLLEKYGLSLKIFDAYRPMEAQEKMWRLNPDERYVSNPAKGGRHTRGTAIDVTLVTSSTGVEVDMPTEFDDFTPRAWSDSEDVTEEQKLNRRLLKEVLEAVGFKQHTYEWWHFDWIGWEKYPVIGSATVFQ